MALLVRMTLGAARLGGGRGAGWSAARGAPPPRDKEARSRQAEMSERADALALPSGGDRAVFGLVTP